MYRDFVTDRIGRFAEAVSRKHAVDSTDSTDCGLGGRVHPHVRLIAAEHLAGNTTKPLIPAESH
jgi:hypothetical protein